MSDRAAAPDDVTPSAPGAVPHDLLRDQHVGRKLGRYDILHRIASGGMGAVYVGRARGVADFERLVAIKVLHQHLAHQEDFVNMFLDEARLAAQIRHPNVVATVDVCPTAEGYFLVMEYVEGDHIGGLLRHAGDAGEQLPEPVVLRIVLDGLAGLAAAHDLTDRTGSPLRLVHRDVSPQNVLVGIDGLARLTDFGVAKAEHRISSTREGQFKGKLAYTSPEHASTGEVEQRSDLFSMGVVLWEALAGRRLFGAATNQATLRRLMEEPIPPPSSVRPSVAPLDAVLEKALSRSLEGRFQTAQEMAEAIEAVAPQVGGLASNRQVAQVVRHYARQKIAREKHAIERAVSELVARSTPPPPGERDEPSHTSIDTVRPGRRSKRMARAGWIVAGVLGLVAAAAAAWLVSRGDRAADGPSAQEPPPMAEPAVAEPAPAGEPDPPAGPAAAVASDGPTGETPAAADVEPAQPETARERRERLRRQRALRRQGAQGTKTSMDTEAPGMEPDILDNPYRGR